MLVVACAWGFRSRAYATFRAVLLGLQVLLASALFPRFHSVWPLFVYGHAAVFVQSLALIRPSMRGLSYRVLISIPGAFFGAGTLLALPWVLLGLFGLELPAVWAPYAVAVLGVLQSLRSAEEQVHLVVADGESVPELKRHPMQASATGRPLSIVQITDPHLGPFMSVARLRRICERAVERKPDLVLLTGDFLTMESQSDPALLAAALAPLAALPGRCFACLGNHDHEAPDTVRSALERAGVILLVDDARELVDRRRASTNLGLGFRVARAQAAPGARVRRASAGPRSPAHRAPARSRRLPPLARRRSRPRIVGSYARWPSRLGQSRSRLDDDARVRESARSRVLGARQRPAVRASRHGTLRLSIAPRRARANRACFSCTPRCYRAALSATV